MDGQEAIENEGQVDDDIVENDTINITEWDAVRLESDESFIKEAVNIPNPNALSDVKDESSSHGRRKRSRSASMGSSASETDSGSYWSCISDEDEKLDDDDIFGFEDSETKFTNSVDVPFLDEKNQNLGQEYDIIPIVSDDNGNERAIKHSERWHEVDEPIQPVEEDEVCSSRIDTSATYQNASSSENGKTEHSTETDTTLATIEEQEDGSTFKKFHSRISGKLQDKLKYHEHVSKFRSISVIEGIYHKQLDQKLEKCLSAYDIIDKFDVKVSEKEAGFTKSDSFNPLRSLSLSLKRTFSTRRSFRSNKSNQVIIAPVSASKDQEPDQNVTQKYGTWPRRKTELQSEKGKLDVSFSVLTTEDGDTVQVISVSPQVQTKKSSGTTGSTESNDISQTNDNYGNDETDAGFPSVNSDNETQGIDSEETGNAEVQKTKVTSVVRVENNHDVFENEEDNVEPIPPPRRRRAKVSDSGIKAVTNGKNFLEGVTLICNHSFSLQYSANICSGR